MEAEQLKKWMENHSFVDKMRAYAVNEIGAKQNYKPFEDLASEGTCTVNISLDHYGNIHMTKGETHKEEAASLEADLKEAEKTIKTQEKEIETLRKQIPKTVEEETEKVTSSEAIAPTVAPRVKRRKP